MKMDSTETILNPGKLKKKILKWQKANEKEIKKKTQHIIIKVIGGKSAII